MKYTAHRAFNSEEAARLATEKNDILMTRNAELGTHLPLPRHTTLSLALCTPHCVAFLLTRPQTTCGLK